MIDSRFGFTVGTGARWLLLARSYEFVERLDDFTRENMRQAEWARATTPVSPGQTPINILIVDDEPRNLTVLEAILDDPSYRLIRAECAEQALLGLLMGIHEIYPAPEARIQ